jgi:hypothetical protein
MESNQLGCKRISQLPHVRPSKTHLQYDRFTESGTIADNYNDCHPDYTIDQASSAVDQDFPQRPKIVILMAGTNDIVR